MAKMKRKGIIVVIFCLWNLVVLWGQQDVHYTQFYFNRLNFNPAYVGYNGDYTLVFQHRSQWLGLEGAPTGQVLSFDMPLAKNKIGIGGSLIRNSIAIESKIDLNTFYAYKMLVGQGTISLGLSASLRNFSMDFSDPRLVATQNLTMDQAISGARESKWLPNFGIGAYYESDNFFAGISAPRLLENNIDFDQDFVIESRQVRQFYIMSGIAIPLQDISIQPMFLLKYVQDIPLSADISVLFSYKNMFTLGTTYRTGGDLMGPGESIDVLGAIKLKSNWTFGFSYDLTLSDIRDYQSGTVEALVRFTMKKENEPEVLNPRFF